MQSQEMPQQFERLFGSVPSIFTAPGRVNLIGEHTDYNDGFVMPCAINFATRVAAARRQDGKLVLRSEEFSEQTEFVVEHLPPHGTGVWSDYIVGVVAMLRDAGHPVSAASLLVRSDVPIGAGLSSSAAVEVASALAFMQLSGARLPMPDVAKLCQRAENIFVGARVGIMDQFVSCLGKQGHALMIDCRSLEYKLIPIPEKVCLVICNTMVKHDHASNAYNRRREECEEGARILARSYPSVRALRDVSLEQLESRVADIPSIVYKRCLHVVSENQRVLEGAKALSNGDVKTFGRLMRESHCSLRDLYEVSCRELDVMVEIAESLEGFCGGRMTGGGFGGCTVNLVRSDSAAHFSEEIGHRYHASTGIKPAIYICTAADGAHAA